MAGLVLRGGFSAGGSGYTPMTPAGAGSPTSMVGAPPSISQQAFGITDGAAPKSVAGTGSVAVGFVALVAMVYLWWSLPR